jgi:acyl-CoA thioesterase-1
MSIRAFSANLVVLLTLLFLVGEVAGSEPPAGGERTIVAFGDSLTAGLGVPKESSFPAVLESKIRKSGYRYRVINAGISGETTSGGLGRVDEIIGMKPEIVILELGANDGLRGIDLGIVQSNLRHIIEKLQEKKIRILLAGMKLPPNMGREYTEGFRKIYPELARRYHLGLIPFLLEGTAARDELNQPDGLHPTANGYKVVAATVWQSLQPMLRKN